MRVVYINLNSASHYINPLNAELNPICHLQASLGAHHILHVSRIRVKGEHPNNISLKYVMAVTAERSSA